MIKSNVKKQSSLHMSNYCKTVYSCVYRTSADRTMALTATSVSMHHYFSRISSNCTVIPAERCTDRPIAKSCTLIGGEVETG